MRQTQDTAAGADTPQRVHTDTGAEPVASELDAAIGERVRMALWRARITQKHLADALGLDQGSVSRRLRGLVAWKASDVETAATLLGVPVAELMGDDSAAAAS